MDLRSHSTKLLSDAVDGFKDKDVYWIDCDKDFEGHRFCDCVKPDLNDPETYFFAYYTKEDPKLEIAQKSLKKMPTYQASVSGGTANANGAFKTDEDLINALGEAVKDNPGAKSVLSNTVRMIHPSTRGHQRIWDVVLKVLNNNGILGTAFVQPLPPKPLTCRGISGDTWMLSRDQAVFALE